MKRIERLKLDINKEDSFNIVNFKQNDTCDLIVSLFQDNKALDLSGQAVTFYVKKPDDTYVEQTSFISTVNNVITINVNEQVVAKEGRAFAELLLTDSNGKLTSASFIINIGEKKVNIDKLIESTDSVAILDEIKLFIEQSKTDLEGFKSSMAEAEGKLNAINVSIEEMKAEIGSINVNLDELKAENEKAVANLASLREGVLEAEATDRELTESIIIATGHINTLKTQIESAENIKIALESLVNNAINEKTELSTKIEEAKASKLNIETVIGEANTTYTTLFDLVEEAKKVIGLVQEFIDSKTPSEDLEQLKADVEKLKLDVASIDLTKYYDKSMVDTLLKKRVATGFVDLIGIDGDKVGVGDFNNAITTGHYRIISVANNAPSGIYEKDDILIVYNARGAGLGSIYQKLVGFKDYERIAKTTPEGDIKWGEWREVGASGGSVDLSNYYNKQEIDTKFDEMVIPDVSNYYTKPEVDAKLDNYRGDIGYSAYVPKPSGYDKAFEWLLQNAKTIYPNMKGNVVGWIQGTISRQTGTNASGARVPGALLITDYNGYYDTLKPVIKNSATTSREFDMVEFKTASGSTLSYTNRNYICYPFQYLEASGTFQDGFVPNISYSYTFGEYYEASLNIYNVDNTIAYEKVEGEVEVKISDFDRAIEEGMYKVKIKEGDVIENNPFLLAFNDDISMMPLSEDALGDFIKASRSADRNIEGVLRVEKAGSFISQELIETNGYIYKRMWDGVAWAQWSKDNMSIIDPNQVGPKGEYITPSLIELNNNNLRVEYGEYMVDTAKNSQHVSDPLREYTDVIYLKAGGFRKVMGCLAFVDKLDFHYSFYCHPKVVLVDPANTPDCLRLYISYNPPEALFKNEAWHPINGLKKIKYCVIGY